MNELKPCPFCGGEAEFVETRQFLDGKTRGYFRCKLYCCEQMFTHIKEEAIEAWNRRVEGVQ